MQNGFFEGGFDVFFLPPPRTLGGWEGGWKSPGQKMKVLVMCATFSSRLPLFIPPQQEVQWLLRCSVGCRNGSRRHHRLARGGPMGWCASRDPSHCAALKVTASALAVAVLHFTAA